MDWSQRDGKLYIQTLTQVEKSWTEDWSEKFLDIFLWRYRSQSLSNRYTKELLVKSANLLPTCYIYQDMWEWKLAYICNRIYEAIDCGAFSQFLVYKLDLSELLPVYFQAQNRKHTVAFRYAVNWVWGMKLGASRPQERHLFFLKTNICIPAPKLH